jgi:hypothetical protein
LECGDSLVTAFFFKPLALARQGQPADRRLWSAEIEIGSSGADLVLSQSRRLTRFR